MREREITFSIITISFPCESFSSATCLTGGNACWKEQDGKLRLRTKEELIGTRYNYEKQNFKGTLGKTILDNAIKVIEILKPLRWYLENPHRSLAWKYIEQNYKDFWAASIVNKASYCMYWDKMVEKKTTFLSNIKLDFIKCNHDKHINFENVHGYDIRSIIPTDLIKDIFKQFKGE